MRLSNHAQTRSRCRKTQRLPAREMMAHRQHGIYTNESVQMGRDEIDRFCNRASHTSREIATEQSGSMRALTWYRQRVPCIRAQENCTLACRHTPTAPSTLATALPRHRHGHQCSAALVRRQAANTKSRQIFFAMPRDHCSPAGSRRGQQARAGLQRGRSRSHESHATKPRIEEAPKTDETVSSPKGKTATHIQTSNTSTDH